MLNQETKRRIDSARDILVGKVPDPKAQVEQITTAMIYKFMDDMDKEAQELGGKARFFTNGYEKYSWTIIMDPKLGGHERLNLYAEAVIKMAENPHIPQLFRDIFKDAFLPYRSPETLSLFLKEINGFKYVHSEDLGDAFEYLLSILGSQGDAGQFRTPRHIIDFIVDVVDPKKEETILDPACGTAGFLISAFKHIQKQHKDKPLSPEDKKRMMNNIVGYDISPDMVKLSKVNMYLHGFPTPHIFEYDTLSSEEKWDETYDVIMANPPFMTPKGGIRPHKRFSVQANRAEVLFVNYIMEHLNINGRAGIIVPEGIIFQSANAYKGLRKMLIEDNYLYAVISLPAGVFQPYSGVKTSVLFLDKNIAKRVNHIMFLKVENDGFELGAQRRINIGTQLPMAVDALKSYVNHVNKGEKLSQTGWPGIAEVDTCPICSFVSKEKIINSRDWNLSGDRYKELVTNPNQKWPMVAISDLCDLGRGRVINRQYIEQHPGPYSVYSSQTQDNGVFGSINSFDFMGEYVTWTTDGANAGTVFYRNGKFNCTNVCGTLKAKTDKVLMKYLSRILNSIAYKYVIQVGNPKLMNNVMAKIKIPLPSLEVQRENVEEIEGYQKIIDGARQIIQIWKPKINIDPKWKKIKLGEICSFEYGGAMTEKNRQVGNYPVVGSNGIVGTHKKFLVKGPVIVVGRKGSAGEVNWIEQNCFPIDTTYYVKNKNDKNFYYKFLYFILLSANLQSLRGGGAVPGLNRNDAYQKEIPFPPLEVQKQIVEKIEEEKKIVNANKRMIEIFEKKIKEKINQIWNG